MTLGKKASFLLIMVMATAMLGYYCVFRFIVLESFRELDEGHARQNIIRCESALNREIRHLNAFAHDWASWDDTCRFLEDRHDDFIHDNLQDQVFEDQKLNLIHIYDRNGLLIWGRTYDLEKKIHLGLDLEADMGSRTFHMLIDQKDPAKSASGVILTRYGVMVVTSNPILTTQNKGPSRGAFVMGRLFTGSVRSMLSEQVNVRLDAWPVKNSGPPGGMDVFVRSLMGADHIRLVEASPGLMHAYSLIRDIGGRPALLMRATVKRDIMDKGTWAYRLGMIVIFSMGIFTHIFMSGMLRFMILNPIRHLKQKATNVREPDNPRQSFETGRDDEIGDLSKEFSAMVNRLRTHRDHLEELVDRRTLDLTKTNEHLWREIEERKRIEQALMKSEEKYLVHFSLANDVLYVIDPEFRVASVSPSVERILGYRPQELLGRPFTDLNVLHPDDLAQAASDTLHVLGGGKVISTVYRFINKQGGIRYGEVSGVPLIENGLVTGVISVARDITAHKQAEEALMISEEKYRTILESIDETYFELDLKGNFTFFSDPLCRALRYSREELTGMNYRSIIAPGNLEEIYQAFHEIFLTGNPKTMIDFQVITSNREQRFAELSASLLRSLTGDPIGFRGVWRDVTERIQAEQAIKESEQRYRRITSSITGYIFTVHMEDGRPVRTVHGPACVGVTGYSPEEFEADPYLWYTMVTEEDRLRIQEHASLIIQGKDINVIEHRIRRKDGQIRYVSNTPVLHYDPYGVLTSYDGVINDITERKQAEEELRKSEERYRITLQSMPDGVSIVRKADVRYLYVNDGFCTMTGYPSDEVLGKTPYDLHLSTQDQDLESLLRAVSGSEGTNGMGARFRARDGHMMETLISARPVQYEGENCMVVVLTDITALRMAEEQKKDLEILLSQAQKMEAIGTLAGGIAHDFNNILTAIIGYTGMAMRCLSDEAKAKKKLQEAIKASERAKDLVCQILAFSRKSETKYKPLALHSAVKESLKMLRALIPTTIEIRYDIMDTIFVMADSTKIHQIIMNLCTNASHSMQETGGILDVSLFHLALNEEAARLLELPSGPYARLTVSDTGHGMAPEVVERIFEPYFTTKEKGRGTGLGLSVVHGIVKSHKGAIICRSEVGKGTMFDIYLPEIESVRESYENRKASSPPVGDERILFVDDEQVMVDVVADMLESLGYDVVTRSSSTEALKLFQETPQNFDMVITDMTMPVMTGDKLACKILEIRPDIPIILCTGYSDLITEDKAYAMGIREFIMKPLDIHKLGGIIRKIMDSKDAESLNAVVGYGIC